MPAAIWIAVETKIGIVCACLPTLLPLFRKAGQSIRSQFSSYLGSSQSRKGGRDPHQHGEPIVILDPERTRSTCPNCNCAYCGGSRAHSNSEVEKPTKKQKGWYSAALSNMSTPETGMQSQGHEEIVVKAKQEGDSIV